MPFSMSIPFRSKKYKALKRKQEEERAKARAKIHNDFGVDLNVGRISVTLGQIGAKFDKDRWIVPESRNISKAKAELIKLRQSTQTVDTGSLILMMKNEFLLNNILETDHELKTLEAKLLPFRKMLDDANERFGRDYDE